VRAGRFTRRLGAGRVVDVGDGHIHGAAPGQRGQPGGDQRGQFCRWDAPPGADLYHEPPLSDHHPGDRAAGQVRGDLTEPAPVQISDARARADRRGDSVDIDTVDDRWPGRTAAW